MVKLLNRPNEEFCVEREAILIRFFFAKIAVMAFATYLGNLKCASQVPSLTKKSVPYAKSIRKANSISST
jgi:hypothetical protein